MSIDLDSFPFPLYEKDREGPEPNQEWKLIRLTLVWLTLEPWAWRPGRVFLVTGTEQQNRERRTEEVWYAQRVEDPLRVSVVPVGNSNLFSPIV